MTSTYKLDTEDGQNITMSVAREEGAKRDQEIAIDGRYSDATGGQGAKVYNKKPIRVYVYKGYHRATIQRSEVPWYLDQGFTDHPTAEEPKPQAVCGVFLGETGAPCPKELLNEVERIHHIRQYHRDIAPFVLTDKDWARVRGELGIAGAQQVVAEYDDSKIVALEEQVAKMSEMMRVMAEEKGQDKQPLPTPTLIPDAPHEPIPLKNYSTHDTTCKYKGKFGRYDPLCPACVALKASKGV